MINITFKPNTLELEINGHSGYNEKGNDIVCSAISTLFYTLGQSLIDSQAMLKERPIFKDEDGAGYISCNPKKKYDRNIAVIYWVILEGMMLVGQNYKKFVHLDIVG